MLYARHVNNKYLGFIDINDKLDNDKKMLMFMFMGSLLSRHF